jgi:hypothetical protein
MRFSFRLVVVVLIALGVFAGTAGAKRDPGDVRKRMDLLYTNPNNATNSDLAFWGNHAFIGYYTGDTGSPAGTGPRGGVRIFDISNPASPTLVKDIACDANQNDPIGRWRARRAAPRASRTGTRPAGRASGSSR